MITWHIKNLQRRPADNFVVSCFWEVVKEKNGYKATITGITNWEGNPIISYENLSPQTVLDWILNKENMDEIESRLDLQINDKITPVLKSGVPWLSGDSINFN